MRRTVREKPGNTYTTWGNENILREKRGRSKLKYKVEYISDLIRYSKSDLWVPSGSSVKLKLYIKM